MFLIAILAGVVVVVWAAIVLPPRVVRRSLDGATMEPPERLAAENEVRRTVFEAAAVLLALVAFYVTLSEVRFTGDQLVLSQAELQLNRETQQRERFAAAVEQLGSANPTIQTAGIFTMEAIASADPVYRDVLDETLAAFLRMAASCDPAAIKPCTPRSPGADPAIQTAVTVLGRAASDPARAERRLDLRRANLSHIDMSGGNFAGTLFVDSNMSFCDVTDTDLRGADMSLARQESIRGRERAVGDERTIWP